MLGCREGAVRLAGLLGFAAIAIAQEPNGTDTDWAAQWARRSAPFAEVVAPFGGRTGFYFSIDTLTAPRGLLPLRVEGRRDVPRISGDWERITLTEEINGLRMRIPFTARLAWYMEEMIARRWKGALVAAVSRGEAQARSGPGRSLEVMGVETAAGRVSLNVRGNVNISGKMVFQDQELARASFRESQTTHFVIDQKQNLNLEGKVGERVSVLMDQDSEREFNWENAIRIHYTGKEDEILQKVEAGNISLSLPSTQFVSFSGSSQGLFGLKSILKLGPVDITSIATIEQTKKEKKRFPGGAEAHEQTVPDYQFRRNTYFFVDRLFRDGGLVTDANGDPFFDPQSNPLYIQSFYPLTANGLHRLGNAVITEIEVYKSVGALAGSGTYYGYAYVDPVLQGGDWRERRPEDEDDTEGSFFQRLTRNTDYVVSEDLGFIRLATPIQNEILAVAYTLFPRDTTGTAEIPPTGELSRSVAAGDTIHLKMLKPLTRSPSHPTWDLEWKNVYSLGASNINKEGFELEVVYKNGALGNDIRHSSGDKFIRLFGLDNVDQNGAQVADDVVDKENPNILNLAAGELILPVLHPFEIDSLLAAQEEVDPEDPLYGGEGSIASALKPILSDSALMYHSAPENPQIRNESKFDIRVKHTSRSTTVNLGGFALVEGSEEIRLNGRLLQRDKDYIIDYFSGTINFLTPDYNDPTAELDILYDKHDLFSLDKKTIVGTRAQIDLGPKSFLGTTALYYNQSVINEKIEVGFEPTRNFIWDVNGRFERELDAPTRWLDRLPLIEATKPTQFTLEGEFAQVLPNPNPVNNAATGDAKGVANIDDFEGSKRTSSVSVGRRFWHRSSVPLGRQGRHRGTFFWYNPYTQVRTRDIWPNQQTSIRAQNELTDVLALRLVPRDAFASLPPDSVWGAVTTGFYSGDFNQAQSKFFEIWLNGNRGKLSIDLGFVSEDQNGNGAYDTEDRPIAGLLAGNTILEDEEDVGLDLCDDPYEDGFGGCLDTITYADAFSQGLWDLIYSGSDLDSADPNGDNWAFSESAAESAAKYRRINGTDGNGTADRPLEGARYPDTEDINRDGNFDSRSDYFTITVDLDSLSADWYAYRGGYTSTGWRLYRIPVAAFEKARPDGAITWDTIKFLRLGLSGVADEADLHIARVEMVGNEWQELGKRPIAGGEYVRDDSVFAVTVVNTEDNADYRPPHGVRGEIDRIHDIRLKEQSLVLKFRQLQSEEEGAAQKNLTELSGERAMSFLSYEKMKLFLYGSGENVGADSTDIEFFLRFGRAEQYYEVAQPVYAGWDANRKRNNLSIDVDFLTRLKVLDPSAPLSNPYDTLVVTDTSRHYIEVAHGGTDSARVARRYTIRGAPALSRLQYFVVGVRNLNPDRPATGEVWMDELRLSQVRKDPGTAFRVQSSIQLAELGSATLNYSLQDANFHVLQQRLGAGKTQEKIRLDVKLDANRLFPQGWGLGIPLTASYSRNVTTPKYLPGSDVLLARSTVADSAYDRSLARSEQLSIASSFGRSGRSDKWWARYTVDGIKLNLSMTQGLDSDEQTARRRNRNSNAVASYALNFGRDNFWEPLKFLKGVPLVGSRLAETQLYYTPSSVDLSANVTATATETTPRVGQVVSQDNVGLARTYKLNYTVLQNLKASFTKTEKSDLDDEFSGRYQEAVRTLNPGTVTDRTESFTTNYTPEFAKWLKPSLGYTANYRWGKPLEQARSGATMSAQTRANSSLTLSPKEILEIFYKPKGAAAAAPKKSRARGVTQVETPPEQKAEGAKSRLGGVLAFVHRWVSQVTPLNLSYSEGWSQNSYQVLGNPSLSYRLGLTRDHGLSTDSTAGVNRGSVNFTRDFSVRSGVNLSRFVTTGLTFGRNLSKTVDGNNVSMVTQSREFIPRGERGDRGYPFANWNIRVMGIEKLPLMKRFCTTAALDHAFSGKETRSWQRDALQSSRYTSSFSPLAGLTMTLIKGITFSTRYSTMKSFDNRFGGIASTRVTTDRTWAASANYNHRGGLKIPIVFFRDFNLQNTVNFTMNLDVTDSDTRERNQEQSRLTLTSRQKSWKVSPRISYSFTQRVTGGVWYEYRESESKVVGRRVDRDFGFDVNIAIQG